jgi:hypothetical protein
LEEWRSSLRGLGIKLAVISVFSFGAKSVLVALQFFGVVSDGGALYLSLSTLLVEAIPSLLTITLLFQYHIGSIYAVRGGHGIARSLLTQEPIEGVGGRA